MARVRYEYYNATGNLVHCHCSKCHKWWQITDNLPQSKNTPKDKMIVHWINA